MSRKKMNVEPFIKPFGYVLSCLAIVQGLTWSILSVLTVLIQTEAWKIDFNETTQELGASIVLGFIAGDNGTFADADLIIKPKNFYIWAIVFLCTSLFWIGFSVWFLIVLVKNQKRDYKKCLLALGVWTIIVCIADLLLTALLANDYNTLVSIYNDKKSLPSLFSVFVCGVLMSIVARGYVLWVVNMVLAIILLLLFSQLPKQFGSLRSEYSTNSLAYLKSPKEQGQRTRYDSESSFGTFQGLPRIPPVQSTNDDLKTKHDSFMANQRSSMYPKQEHPEYFIKPNQNFRKQ